MARLRNRQRSSVPVFPTYDDLNPQLTDAVRSVLNQHELDTDELPKSIAVVSALHGEGVTSVCQAISLVIAHEINGSVCLVDCSWMQENESPRDDSGPGMYELMTDQCSVGEALRPAGGEPQLMVLGAGNVPPNRRHALARSAQFERLIDLLNDELDHVVFDTPPMLRGAAGLAVLRHADAHLLVVRHGATTLPQVRAVNQKLAAVPQLGVILNGYRSSVPSRIRRLLAT